MLRLLQQWIWRDPLRCANTLLRFAEVEADSGRDMVRAAELTTDSTLRRLYLAHARDERRHAELFRERGAALLRTLHAQKPSGFSAQWLTPGERGLDDLRVDAHSDSSLLAFVHLSEKVAAQDFARYCTMLGHDPQTRAVFDEVLRDEVFHMNYTVAQLARLEPLRKRRLLWQAQLGRLWKGFLRLTTALAGLMGTVILTLQYLVLLAPFAWLAGRAARREPVGWNAVSISRMSRLERQY